ncbi:hypothetical protein D3C77_647450 [compost metagenome]
MLATIIAPTSTIAIGPRSVSKMHTTRSLRANSSGTPWAVTVFTEKMRPGT